MKLIYTFLIAIALAATTSCTTSRYYSGENDYENYSESGITYDQFYNGLSPYGNWVSYQDYGQVWIPYERGFRPYYTNGYWVYTNYGWTWRSNYDWGWAPFHYGRWIQDPFSRWMWVPGYEWAPAWVSWRGGGNYYGWAPLGPHMNYNEIPYNNWTFVPSRYITSPRINNYYVNQSRNTTIINNTTVYNNNISNNRNRPAYNPGPSATEVERSTRMKVREFKVVESNQPGTAQISQNSIRVYKPTVNISPENQMVSPTNVDNTRDTQPNVNNTLPQRKQAPTRVFDRSQTPQINKNEPPVKQSPEKELRERPVRLLPSSPTPPAVKTPATERQTDKREAPVNVAPKPEIPKNNPPVRMLPNKPAPPVENQLQRSENPQRQENRTNSASPNNPENIRRAPVRRMDPPAPAMNNRVPQRSATPAPPVRQMREPQATERNFQPRTEPAARQNSTEREERPAQNIRRFE